MISKIFQIATVGDQGSRRQSSNPIFTFTKCSSGKGTRFQVGKSNHYLSMMALKAQSPNRFSRRRYATLHHSRTSKIRFYTVELLFYPACGRNRYRITCIKYKQKRLEPNIWKDESGQRWFGRWVTVWMQITTQNSSLSWFLHLSWIAEYNRKVNFGVWTSLV